MTGWVQPQGPALVPQRLMRCRYADSSAHDTSKLSDIVSRVPSPPCPYCELLKRPYFISSRCKEGRDSRGNLSVEGSVSGVDSYAVLLTLPHLGRNRSICYRENILEPHLIVSLIPCTIVEVQLVEIVVLGSASTL